MELRSLMKSHTIPWLPKTGVISVSSVAMPVSYSVTFSVFRWLSWFHRMCVLITLTLPARGPKEKCSDLGILICQREAMKCFLSRHPWLTPEILATQEAVIRKTAVRSQPRQTVHETLSWKKLSQKRSGGVTQGVGPEFKSQYQNK
jgi:hypothetical protein